MLFVVLNAVISAAYSADTLTAKIEYSENSNIKRWFENIKLLKGDGRVETARGNISCNNHLKM